MLKRHRIVVVGAGIGGLAAALDLAVAGCDVTVVERASAPGGKIRSIEIGGHAIDAGPTVFTMRWVFDQLFANAGTSLSDHLRLHQADVLARHAWDWSAHLDLFSDVAKSADAIARFAGPAEGRGYVAFADRARSTYEALESSFILAARPSPVSLALGAGLRGIADLWQISPFATLWQELGEYFHDPRLRQLFGRYATYCGSSPFDCPATLMLVAHVERAGVWLVDGGMHEVARAVADLAVQRGANIRYQSNAADVTTASGRVSGVKLESGERIECDAVIVNADAAALTQGLLGRGAQRAIDVQNSQRSLSAVTWAVHTETSGFPLMRHNVFFSRNYRAEFDNIFRLGQLPDEPTVYVCAQDRDGGAAEPQCGERLLVLVNAPARGDTHAFGKEEIAQCQSRAFSALKRCGLTIHPSTDTPVATTPTDFARLYPGTGGALYGQASHGWRASFTRPPAKTRVPGLYLAGGSVHPGPGVPMAALSGRMAAAQLLEGLRSIGR